MNEFPLEPEGGHPARYVAAMETPTDPSPPDEQPLGRFQFTLRSLFVLTAIVAICFGILASLIRWARDAGERAECRGLRIGMIYMAICNYESQHGHLPPSYIADSKGKPMHSWRVLILPYLGCQGLFDRYDFSEAWDGPHNRLLAKAMPSEYRCPAYRGRNPYSTNYLAVVGPKTAWPVGKTIAEKDITDRRSETLLLVEVADSDINWMEPRDMSVSQAVAGVNVDRRHGISSNHGGGACCSFAAYSHGFLRDETPPEVIRALLTINGNEPLEETDDRQGFYLKDKGH